MTSMTSRVATTARFEVFSDRVYAKNDRVAIGRVDRRDFLPLPAIQSGLLV